MKLELKVMPGVILDLTLDLQCIHDIILDLHTQKNYGLSGLNSQSVH